MMDFEVKNADAVINALLTDTKKALNTAMRGLRKGMTFFGSGVQQRQLTGRKSDGYGLKRQTGTLARSWVVSMLAERDGWMYGFSKLAPYVIYHQKPPGFENIAPKIPKRLHILEEWPTHGVPVIKKEVAQALLNMKNRK